MKKWNVYGDNDAQISIRYAYLSQKTVANPAKYTYMYNKRPMGHIAHLRTTIVHEKIEPQYWLKEKKDIIFSLKTK